MIAAFLGLSTWKKIVDVIVVLAIVGGISWVYFALANRAAEIETLTNKNAQLSTAAQDPERIYQLEGLDEYECLISEWRFLSDEDSMPVQIQHKPTSVVFYVDMDIPEGAETFSPVTCIYAVLVHCCDDHPMPANDEVVMIGRQGLTMWLLNGDFLRKL